MFSDQSQVMIFKLLSDHSLKRIKDTHQITMKFRESINKEWFYEWLWMSSTSDTISNYLQLRIIPQTFEFNVSINKEWL